MLEVGGDRVRRDSSDERQVGEEQTLLLNSNTLQREALSGSLPLRQSPITEQRPLP